MSAAAPSWLLLIQERVALIQPALAAQNVHELALPFGHATLLAGEPPTPLQIEHAIERVEDAVMGARTHLGAGARLATRDAALHALARHAGVDAGGWLGIDAVEALFNRLAARAAGRPAAQDALPVDAPSAARLLILRELLHHGGLSGIQCRD